MITPIWIFVFVLIVCTFLWVIFKRSKRHASREFSLKVRELKLEIVLNDQQIGRRIKYLDRYDFLKYNLSEALRVQIEVKV